MKKKFDKLLNKRNVIGYSDKGDKVEVFVEKKYDKATAKRLISTESVDFWEKDLVPKFLTKWFKKKKTKVVEVGTAKTQVTPDRKRYDPIKGGSEIAIKGTRFVGTVGGLVYKRNFGALQLYDKWDSFIRFLDKYGYSYDEEKYILTNSHVAAKDVFNPESDNVYLQPFSGRRIADSAFTVPFRKDRDNYLDASIIKVDDEIVSEQIPGWEINGFRYDVRGGEELKKYGRTTRETTGKLMSKNVTIRINHRGDIVLFRDVWRTTRMSAGGDSGSMVLDKDNNVVGLIFAGGPEDTFIIPIESIVKHFKLSGVY